MNKTKIKVVTGIIAGAVLTAGAFGIADEGAKVEGATVKKVDQTTFTVTEQKTVTTVATSTIKSMRVRISFIQKQIDALTAQKNSLLQNIADAEAAGVIE
jgi:hypothetical protein